MSIIYVPNKTIRGKKLAQLVSFYVVGKNILDFGCSDFSVSKFLAKNSDLNVTGVDIRRPKNIPPEFNFFQYKQGEKFPFKDKSFGTSLCLFVLHHTDDPEFYLKELKRVTKSRIILAEDILTSKISNKYIKFADSLINLEFEGHPHSNFTNDQWKSIFDNLGLEISDEFERNFIVYFLYMKCRFYILNCT